MLDRYLTLLNELRVSRYSDSAAMFFAGSLRRGEGTKSSDLDVVVIFEELPNAYRETFHFQGWPVDAFIHDPETLAYVFEYHDKQSAFPTMSTMISEGIEIPEATAFSRKIKQKANDLLKSGPNEMTPDEIERARYTITCVIDDIRHFRSEEEALASAAALHGYLANYYLRRQGLWSAQAKTIPRTLKRIDADFEVRFSQAFSKFFKTYKSDDLIALTEHILEPDGGWIFEGYASQAPKEWRLGKAECNEKLEHAPE